MRLISVNIGKAQPLEAKPAGRTGIYKRPVQGPVHIDPLGLAGDAICDTKNHGGPDQAVYVYGVADYEWWSRELGRELVPGTFGENLTVSGLESAGFSIGDRLCLGTVMLEVTAPRGPCVTLAAKMGDPEFVKCFRQAGRPGLYCRVIQEGEVRAGDEVSLEPYRSETATLLEIFRDHYEKSADEATLRRFLRAPVAIRARKELEERLRKLRHETSDAWETSEVC